MHLLRTTSIMVGTAAAAATLSLSPTSAYAAQLVGCSENSLVSAINAANAVGGDDLVLSPFCTYTLTSAHGTGPNGPSGLPVITTPITITGLSTDIARAPGAPEFRIAEIDGPGSYPATAGALTLNAVTLRGGDAPAGEVGGGVANFGGSLSANVTTLRNNSADRGGGLYNQNGSSTLAGSTVVGNTATVLDGGGGIYEASGSVTLLGTLVRSNSPSNCAPVASVPFCNG